MRVLHLGTGNLYGGIETFLVMLARLEKDGSALRNHFLLSHEGRLCAELRSVGATPEVIAGARLRHPWSVLRARRLSRAYARTVQPDVVVAHGPWAYVVFGAGLPDSTQLVFYQHGAATRDLLHRLASTRAPSGVIANSPYTASTTSQVFPEARVEICRYPVFAPKVRRPPPDVRAALGAGEDPVILQTSRLEAWKGQALLLEALGSLTDQRWRLWLAGGSARPAERRYRRELETLAERLRISDRVTFLGERDDIGDLLGAADLFCQPNVDREPYGITVVEAMSAGLPIVATDLGSTADPIGPEIGRRVAARPEALAPALRELLADRSLRDRLGAAARRRFETDFSAPAALEHLESVIRAFSRSRAHRTWS